MCSIDEKTSKKNAFSGNCVLLGALQMNWNAFGAFWNRAVVYFWCLLSAAQPILFLYQHAYDIALILTHSDRYRLCRPLFTSHLFFTRLVIFHFDFFSWNICALRMRNATVTSCSMLFIPNLVQQQFVQFIGHVKSQHIHCIAIATN